jgi:squalene synthase HpnC
LAEGVAWCRRRALGHYENFPVLSMLAPTALHDDLAAVYAWCRFADDLADELGPPPIALAALNRWGRETEAMFAGQPRHPITVALADTARRHGITPEPFANLLRAFRQDQTKRRYATHAEVVDYCTGSADPVGRLVLRLLGRDDTDRVGRSDAVCTGLQLINFLQDVRRDFLERDRIYLPLDELAAAGSSEADLADGVAKGNASPALKEAIRAGVERAEGLLREGLPLARSLRGRAGLMVAGFALGGLAIARKLRAQGFDPLKRRPKLMKLDLPRLFLRAGWETLRPG